MPGSLNDINIVNWSLLMNKIVNGELPPVQFVANGVHTTMATILRMHLPEVANICEAVEKTER